MNILISEGWEKILGNTRGKPYTPERNMIALCLILTLQIINSTLESLKKWEYSIHISVMTRRQSLEWPDINSTAPRQKRLSWWMRSFHVYICSCWRISQEHYITSGSFIPWWLIPATFNTRIYYAACDRKRYKRRVNKNVHSAYLLMFFLLFSMPVQMLGIDPPCQ